MSDLINESVNCPYCGETIDVTIEVLGEDQEYTEDCQVCCRPIVFSIGTDYEGNYSLNVRSEDETF